MAMVCLGLTACGGEQAEPAAATEDAHPEHSIADVNIKPGMEDASAIGGKLGFPYSIDYEIIGTPIVGSPVTVNLQVESLVGSYPLTLDYRIRDASSMVLVESQPSSVRMVPATNEVSFRQQVSMIPQREGRFYLNVSASIEAENGTISTVTAIPIQVGSGARELQQNGDVQVDENGDAVRILTNE
jgi:hypothetical protein